MGGEFGGAAVALLLLSSILRACFESAALLPLSLAARHGVHGSQRQYSSPPHWLRGHGAPPPLLADAARALLLLTSTLRARHSCVGDAEGAALLSLSLVEWHGVHGN